MGDQTRALLELLDDAVRTLDEARRFDIGERFIGELDAAERIIVGVSEEIESGGGLDEEEA